MTSIFVTSIFMTALINFSDSDSDNWQGTE
jgi:hypothetical protein